MSVDEAISDIPNGSLLLCGGFGICGIPTTIFEAIRAKGLKDLTCVSNNAGIDMTDAEGNRRVEGLGILLESRQVKRMISSYIGENKMFEQLYFGGELEFQITPQGTLAEKIRCGGAGIPAFYTPTGAGTMVAKGEFPLKVDSEGKPAMLGEAKEEREFNGRKYIMEEAIKGDFAIVKAWKADKMGNLVYRGTANNFNGVMAMAGKTTIVEAEEIVEVGEIPPDQIHTPAIYVNRIVQSTSENKIEKYTTKETMGGAVKPERERIGRRAACEFQDGMFVNLGIGIPTLAANYAPAGVNIMLHSENGLLGIGAYPTKAEADADFINAGKETVTMMTGASLFDSAESFAMVRGGHVDVTMLGALQVSSNGDLANWIIPQKMMKGMGGAMDLVGSGNRVIVTMEHTARGKPKIFDECTLPLGGMRCVNTIITEMCVLQITPNGMVLTELAPGISAEDVRAVTPATFTVADDVKEMLQV